MRDIYILYLLTMYVKLKEMIVHNMYTYIFILFLFCYKLKL